VYGIVLQDVELAGKERWLVPGLRQEFLMLTDVLLRCLFPRDPVPVRSGFHVSNVASRRDHVYANTPGGRTSGTVECGNAIGCRMAWRGPAL
jgi:hypothetical protein